MRRTHTLAKAFVGFAGLAVPAGAQPNNACVNATPLPLNGSVTGSTAGASWDGGSTCDSSLFSPDVWHWIDIPCLGELTIYTCPASFDSIISLHTGCPGTTANQITCNDDSPYCGSAYPQASMFSGPVDPGRYVIRVAGYMGASGTYTLNSVFSAGAPSNDNIANATFLGHGTTQGCTTGATPDGAADCGQSTPSPDVWYYYAAACDGILDLYTCPVSFDTVISVHSGSPGTLANQIACNDDSAYCGAVYPRASYIPLPVVAGHSYFIRVAGFQGAVGGFTLNAYLNAVAPSNDACSGATPIGNGSIFGSTTCATLDGSSGCVLTGASAPDVWYRYTAACSGSLAVYTCPASYDTVVSVHSGCPGTTANQITCNDDSAYCGTAYPLTSYVNVPVVEGRPYFIRVSGVGALSGTFILNTAVSCCYPNCDGSTSAPALNVADFICFLNRFGAGDTYANCDHSTVAPALNVADFGCFLNSFAVGCP